MKQGANKLVSPMLVNLILILISVLARLDMQWIVKCICTAEGFAPECIILLGCVYMYNIIIATLLIMPV